MFDTMRRHSQSFFIYILLGAIIAVFVVSFGPGGGGCRTEVPFAAVVNGETINEDEFRRTYGEQIRYFQQMNSRGGLTPELMKQLKLKEQVMDQLVDSRLLKQGAKKAGISVSEAELRDFILKSPAFQVEGKFDYKAYERYVNYAVGTTPARFEADLRDKLLAQKYRDIVETTAMVSNEELWGDYQDEHDKVDLYFVAFKEVDVASVEVPTTAEIAAFEKDHAKEIEDRYGRDITKYKEPRKYRSRHIVVKVAEKGAVADVEAAKQKITEIEVKARAAGADFAALAKEFSEDSAKDKGGDLGFLSAGMMLPAYEDAVAKLKAGEISPPVRTSTGWHLIKLEEVKEASGRELKDASADVAKELLTEQRRSAKSKLAAEKFLADLKSGKSITDLAVAEPEQTADATVKKKADASGKPFYKTTGSFGRTSMAVPRIGFAEGLVKDSFTLSNEKKLLDQPYKSSDRWIVVALKERQTPVRAEFDKELEKLRQAALGRKKGEWVRSYLKAQRDSGEVKLNDKMLSYDESANQQQDPQFPMD